MNPENNQFEDPSLQTKKRYECTTCERSYTSRQHLWRHRKFECGKAPTFFCDECDYSSKHRSNLNNHMRNRDANGKCPKRRRRVF